MKAPLSCMAFLSVSMAIGQYWNSVATFQLAPPTMGQGADGRYRLALSGDRIAIGDPSGGSGSVRVFRRNAGGAGTWEIVAVITGSLPWGSFGKALALHDEVLIVGGFWGAWQYQLAGDLAVFQRQLSDQSAWNVVYDGERAVICGPLVPSFPTGLLSWFDDEVTGELEQSGSLALPPHSEFLSSCMGASLCYAHPYLVVSDSCWSTTNLSPQTGLIRTLRWEEGTTSFSVDATEGAFGGYWPFGEGVIMGSHFGRSLAIKGDTLFVGIGETTGGDPSHVEVLIKAPTGWEPYGRVFPSSAAPADMMENMGLALAVSERELFIGTDHGYAIYTEEGPEWVFQEFHELGGAVSAIALDRTRVAVAVPSLGQVHIYERIGTGVQEAGSAGSLVLACMPNPAADHVTVGRIGRGSTMTTLVLIDAMGRTIRSIPWNGSTPLELDLSDIPDQVLMVRAEDNTGRLIGAARLVVGDY